MMNSARFAAANRKLWRALYFRLTWFGCSVRRRNLAATCPLLASIPRYNLQPGMQSPRYALVAYIKSPPGEFVENLRRELHPDLPHLAAHLTVLPPRPLQGTEAEALQELERLCREEEAFEVSLGGVDTFIPVTPTVFIRIDGTSSRMRELHSRLNTGALAFCEELPYIPHLTIVKMSAEPLAQNAFQIARERWAQYHGSRRILLESLTFVREDGQNCWVDLAPIHLGRSLVSR
jgi:2'-5' RNA ligase